jgi:uncharacterized protein (DUF305 family)
MSILVPRMSILMPRTWTLDAKQLVLRLRNSFLSGSKSTHQVGSTRSSGFRTWDSPRIIPIVRHPIRPIILGLSVLAACKGEQESSMAREMAPVTIPKGADYTEADVRFMQGMIHHHAQAIQMASLAPTHGANSRVALLCKKIDISQRDEIAMMKGWLASRHQFVPDDKDPHPMMMPGMLTPEQMTALAAAKDTVFDRLFLTGMIQHHQGAIKMVSDLFASGGGQAPEMSGYANGIDNDQRGEIAVMQQLLSNPPRGPGQ